MERAAGPKTALLGRVRDRAAGTAFVALHDDVAMVHALEVVPGFRRAGVARNLMQGAAVLGAGCRRAMDGAGRDRGERRRPRALCRPWDAGSGALSLPRQRSRRMTDSPTALNLPPVDPLPEATAKYFRICEEKLGLVPNVLRAHAFDIDKLTPSPRSTTT
jgi:hypothetical protein